MEERPAPVILPQGYPPTLRLQNHRAWAGLGSNTHGNAGHEQNRLARFPPAGALHLRVSLKTNRESPDGQVDRKWRDANDESLRSLLPR